MTAAGSGAAVDTDPGMRRKVSMPAHSVGAFREPIARYLCQVQL